MRKHVAAQRRAIKLTPFPKFIDRETGTRCLVALVAAVKHLLISLPTLIRIKCREM
jgi:hypothetical protein